MIHVYYKLRKIIVADVVPTSTTGKEGNDKQARSKNGNEMETAGSRSEDPSGSKAKPCWGLRGAKPPEAAGFYQNFKSISCKRNNETSFFSSKYVALKKVS